MPRSKSSRRWLKEHFDDEYVKKAQAKGYRSRAVFKLLEIQDKYRIIKPGMNVVDLGAAPGGWSQLVVELLKGKGHIIATDILPMEPMEGVEFIQGDFREEAVLSQLLTAMGDEKADVVLSDMAPNMSGNKSVDQPRGMYLAELALDCASKILKPGGVFVVKAFQGEGFDVYLKDFRSRFNQVKPFKPKASRGRSQEVYLVGIGFI